VPRTRLNGSGGKTTEWKSQVLRNYQRRTRAADALIAGAYLAGTNNTPFCALPDGSVGTMASFANSPSRAGVWRGTGKSLW
jgi:hypothetical protein